MELDELFRSVGGVATMQGDDPNTVEWNFGIARDVTAVDTGKTFYQAFPNLQGRWDGETTVCHHNAVRKVLGRDIEPQQQPKGTCGGRSGSRATEILQCILIANGKRAKFKYVSHAWPYFLARREWNMLRGGDGVAGGSIPPVLAKFGALNREESGDTNPAGPGSDDLAAAWGAGRLSGDKLREFEELASDNIVKISTKITSAQEMADALASGAVISCSDSRGYSMQRDRDGFCKPQGTWYHYHVRSGLVNRNGRKGFVYDQSWGRNTPGGPVLEGWPDNCFAVDWDVDEQNIRNGSFHALIGMDLWEMEKGNFDLDWIFI